MQDSRASGQTGAMEHLTDWREAFDSAIISIRNHNLEEWELHMVADRVEAAIRALRAVLPALSPPAIGDGEMREILAQEYERESLQDCAEDMREGAVCDDSRDRAALAAMHRVALHTDEKKGG